MAKIKIRKSRLIRKELRLLGTVLITAGYGWLLQMTNESTFIILAILLSPLLIILWTSFIILEVNDDDHYWWQYKWILGFKLGSKNDYEQIDHIALREKVVQTQRQEEVIRYEGIVVFDDQSECPLTKRKSLRFMQEKMKELADKVNVPVYSEIEQTE